MKLRTRTFLLIGILMAITVLSITGALVWSGRQAIVKQTEADGIAIASLLARSAGFAYQVPIDMENSISDQMVAEAMITAHLVAIAEKAGLSTAQIKSHLVDISDSTVLNEFWITDDKGHAYLTSTNIEFTFDPDPKKQPQASEFYGLITGDKRIVIQDARQREIDGRVFKYVGVPGVDKPSIVQVGYNAAFLDKLRKQVGLDRLLAELVSSDSVIAIHVVDKKYVTIAYDAVNRSPQSELSDSDKANLSQAISNQKTYSYMEGDILKVIAPFTDSRGQVIGAAIVFLPTENAKEAVNQQLEIAAFIAALTLVIGLLISAAITRRVTTPIEHLTTAAAAVEAGHFDSVELSDVAARKDELGQMARVFQKMVEQVKTREEKLRAEVQSLRIIVDESKKMREVEEITDTDYFRELKDKVKKLRDQEGR